MKTARFFCESCGRAVPFNARMCSACGKTFDAVKCPVCTYTGLPGEFLQGCPKCGYLAAPEDASAPTEVSGLSPDGVGRVRRRKRTPDDELFRELPPKPRGFPTWAYTTILILLVGILVAMATLLFV